ncbi:hypothetical protein GGX14DRAFT_387705 [Mycena pura]|uniref:DUF6534 domain-containing protein n=1 Tax=Mycena pura TaxID=153505 RepID=A0AAD7E1B5_9AGAR|nr:hypothetical protein GGX14DRAFT_387705 [Mycena pura]
MSNYTAATQASHSVDGAFLRLWGVQYVTYTLDIVLWAIAVVNAAQYFRKYSRKDPLLIRTTVAILLTVTTIHTLFLSIQDFKDFVLLFGNFEGQDEIFWETDVMICATFLVAFVAQMFYASRIWILSKRDWRYVTPVILLALVQLSFGIAQTVEVAKVHRYSKLATTVVTSTAQGAATAACDMTITTILFYILRAVRTGVRRTDSAVDKMIIYAFNRGAMTRASVKLLRLISLMAILQLIFFITKPGTFFLLTFRETLRAQMSGRDGLITSFNMTSMAANSVHPNTSTEPGVHVSKSVIKWVDDIPEEQISDNRWVDGIPGNDNQDNGGPNKMALQPRYIQYAPKGGIYSQYWEGDAIYYPGHVHLPIAPNTKRDHMRETRRVFRQLIVNPKDELAKMISLSMIN